MTDAALTTVSLSGHAADLSATLHFLQEACGHETTSADISAIATELSLLSTTLWRLYEAMAADPSQYNESFNQDLGEITLELKLVFEEITDCCECLQKADSLSTSSVAWMFKKGKVHRLQKYLETLKSTLMVMRTVLWHGKDYGTHNSTGRLAESSPRTMHEDRVILESVFEKNRNAIVDLHMLDSGHQHGSSSSSSTPSAAGTHRRHLSSSAGVECPPLPDVLPSPMVERKDFNGPNTPSRRFSKRGVRLAVHSSILDMDAHKVPTHLKNKWIQVSRDNSAVGTHERQISGAANHMSVLPTMPENVSPKGTLEESSKGENVSHTSLIGEYDSGEDYSGHVPPKLQASIKNVASPLRRMIHRLSISHQTPSAEPTSPKQGSSCEPLKQHKMFSIPGMMKPKPGLTTPDYEREFENGV